MTFWELIKLLIIRTILAVAPWSLGGGVPVAYLEQVSLAQGGGRAKTKVTTRIQLISLSQWREASASSNVTAKLPLPFTGSAVLPR